jgi:hypothetical protein
MKSATPIALILFSLIGTTAAFAEEQAATAPVTTGVEQQAATAAAATEAEEQEATATETEEQEATEAAAIESEDQEASEAAASEAAEQAATATAATGAEEQAATESGASGGEEQAGSEPSESVQAVEIIEIATPAPESAAETQPATEAVTPPPGPMGRHCKHKARMMSGEAGPGMGHAGKKACPNKKAAACQARHQQVVDRLDMIEARLAKIEAMLEALVRRQ